VQEYILKALEFEKVAAVQKRATEVNLARRPTGYIPTPAIDHFALGSDAVCGHLKVLYPATRWGHGVEIPMAVML